MGVRKFRSVEQMPGPPPLRPLDPENLRIAFGLMDLAHRLAPLEYRPGVRRFASYSDLLLDRERREAASIRALREARVRRG